MYMYKKILIKISTFNVLLKNICRKKKHIIYLKSQIYLLFSEPLLMRNLSIDKASDEKRNICDFK